MLESPDTPFAVLRGAIAMLTSHAIVWIGCEQGDRGGR